MAQRIQDRLEDILDHHKVAALPGDVLAEMKKIRDAGVRELTRDRQGHRM